MWDLIIARLVRVNIGNIYGLDDSVDTDGLILIRLFVITVSADNQVHNGAWTSTGTMLTAKSE